MLERDNLPPLPEFSQLSDRVWRVLGLNPSPFTLQGTNTYLVGRGDRKILIDCGQGMPAYVPLLQQSLESISPHAYISDVLLTHSHMDHWGGLEYLLEACDGQITVHKYPLHPESYEQTVFMQGFPCTPQDLRDGQVFQVDDETTLHVVHTPGHTSDHCCFWLEEENAMFAGDCVLGHGTVTFDDLTTYLQTLDRLLAFEPHHLYPGHGPVVEDGVAKIHEYIDFRRQRENEILDLILSDRSKPWTPLEIGSILRDKKPGDLQPAYLRGIALHVMKLESDGKLKSAMHNGPASGPLSAIRFDDLAEILKKEWFFIDNSRL
ncbi:hypothetical protein LRAMOSA02806 [Lichtheimia ramosa]|uniref:Metallo-beta-lactamase domain-containing protein n=1 Tax=Lichtheimia ramosa TaxID=688394 RepID=A0A077WSB8_9FUNG|nr:hypothetical protein LRAMOSA02806 [Lichtheimia ramosa]